MKLYVARDNKLIDISNEAGEISWQDSIDTLGQQMNITTINNFNVGDFFILKENDDEVFQGIAVEKDKVFNKNRITVFDFAWYLNESEEVVQFNNVASNQAITQLLSKYSVKLGAIEASTIMINRIYRDKKVSDIIRDILSIVSSKTGEKYRVEMRSGYLFIEKYSKLEIDPFYKPAVNLSEVDSKKAISKDFNYKESISNLKNKIIVIGNKEKSTAILAEVENQESISQYGLLQEVITVEDSEVSQVRNIANKMLNDLNRKGVDLNISVPGNVELKSGRYINISNQYFSGDFLIKGTSHNYSNGIYKTSLTLGDDKNVG